MQLFGNYIFVQHIVIVAHHGVALIPNLPPILPPSSLRVYRSYLFHALTMGGQAQCQMLVFAAERMVGYCDGHSLPVTWPAIVSLTFHLCSIEIS